MEGFWKVIREVTREADLGEFGVIRSEAAAMGVATSEWHKAASAVLQTMSPTSLFMGPNGAPKSYWAEAGGFPP